MADRKSPIPQTREGRQAALLLLAMALGIAAVAAVFVVDGQAITLSSVLVFLATTLFVGGAGGAMLVGVRRQLIETRKKLNTVLDERRRTDMAFREAETRLRDVLEGSVLGMLILRDLRPLYANSALVSILGYPSTDALLAVRNSLDFVVPDERERVRGYITSREAGDLAPLVFECQALRHDGTVIWVENGVRPIMWSGEPVVFLTIADITERKKAEEELKKSESRLTRAQAIAHLGNWERRYGDNSLWWSDETYRIFGLSPEVFHPSYDGFLNAVHPDDRGLVEEAVRRAMDTSAPYSIDHRIVRPDGSVRHVHEQGEARCDDVGNRVAMIGTVHDITERKLGEQALKESERRHRDFAADVAHELRTPLSVMRANLDNLSDQSIARPLREDVDAMARLVEQLLAASRAEMLNVDATEQCNISAVCVSVASYMAPLAIQRQRSIEVTGAEAPVWVRGNAGALEQAVRNLIENAIKYSDPDTVITIMIDKARPSLSVINQGQGIPLSKRDEIFSRFTRADRRAAGTGLGLSIVRRIVDAHGARIVVRDPKSGEGVCFRIDFSEVVAIRPSEGVVV